MKSTKKDETDQGLSMMLIQDAKINTLVRQANKTLNLTQVSNPANREDADYDYPYPTVPPQAAYQQEVAAQNLRLSPNHLPQPTPLCVINAAPSPTTSAMANTTSVQTTTQPTIPQAFILSQPVLTPQPLPHPRIQPVHIMPNQTREEIDSNKFKALKDKLFFQSLKLKKQQAGLQAALNKDKTAGATGRSDKGGELRVENPKDDPLHTLKKIMHSHGKSADKDKNRWAKLSYERSLPRNIGKVKTLNMQQLKKYFENEQEAQAYHQSGVMISQADPTPYPSGQLDHQSNQHSIKKGNELSLPGSPSAAVVGPKEGSAYNQISLQTSPVIQPSSQNSSRLNSAEKPRHHGPPKQYSIRIRKVGEENITQAEIQEAFQKSQAGEKPPSQQLNKSESKRSSKALSPKEAPLPSEELKGSADLSPPSGKLPQQVQKNERQGQTFNSSNTNSEELAQADIAEIEEFLDKMRSFFLSYTRRTMRQLLKFLLQPTTKNTVGIIQKLSKKSGQHSTITKQMILLEQQKEQQALLVDVRRKAIEAFGRFDLLLAAKTSPLVNLSISVLIKEITNDYIIFQLICNDLFTVDFSLPCSASVITDNPNQSPVQANRRNTQQVAKPQYSFPWEAASAKLYQLATSISSPLVSKKPSPELKEHLTGTKLPYPTVMVGSPTKLPKQIVPPIEPKQDHPVTVMCNNPGPQTINLLKNHYPQVESFFRSLYFLLVSKTCLIRGIHMRMVILPTPEVQVTVKKVSHFLRRMIDQKHQDVAKIVKPMMSGVHATGTIEMEYDGADGVSPEAYWRNYTHAYPNLFRPKNEEIDSGIISKKHSHDNIEEANKSLDPRPDRKDTLLGLPAHIMFSDDFLREETVLPYLRLFLFSYTFAYQDEICVLIMRIRIENAVEFYSKASLLPQTINDLLDLIYGEVYMPKRQTMILVPGLSMLLQSLPPEELSLLSTLLSRFLYSLHPSEELTTFMKRVFPSKIRSLSLKQLFLEGQDADEPINFPAGQGQNRSPTNGSGTSTSPASASLLPAIRLVPQTAKSIEDFHAAVKKSEDEIKALSDYIFFKHYLTRKILFGKHKFYLNLNYQSKCSPG
jgi:hypothetical protein